MLPLTAEELGFSYGGREVLRGVTLPARPGAVVALLGANGCGKTTLLKLLLGLLRPQRGRVVLEGEELRRWTPRELARRVAYVPQVHREAFAYTVGELVLMGRMPHLSFLARHGAADLAAAEEAMERVGIAHLSGRPCNEVSGGERQLALIARALTQGARVLVMDEPTSGLDYGNQLRLLERIGRLAAHGQVVLFTTHHPDHALAVAERVVMLAGGRVVRDGPPGQVITGESLSRLYGVEVRTAHVEGGGRVCLPGFRCPAPSTAQPDPEPGSLPA